MFQASDEPLLYWYEVVFHGHILVNDGLERTWLLLLISFSGNSSSLTRPCAFSFVTAVVADFPSDLTNDGCPSLIELMRDALLLCVMEKTGDFSGDIAREYGRIVSTSAS